MDDPVGARAREQHNRTSDGECQSGRLGDEDLQRVIKRQTWGRGRSARCDLAYARCGAEAAVPGENRKNGSTPRLGAGNGIDAVARGSEPARRAVDSGG